MMGSGASPAMGLSRRANPLRRRQRSRRSKRRAGLLGGLRPRWVPAALLLIGGQALAAMPAAANELGYPSTDLFRSLQLNVLACGRENTPGSCDIARRTADPLLDHPRLPASCKDVLWTIRERAVVAPANSFNRREQLNRAAADLIPLCRDRDVVRPVVKPEERRPPGLRF